MAALRLASPSPGLALHSRQLQRLRLLPPGLRHASTAPPKPRLLEKPERFNPPSHPARLRSKPKYTGAPLSEHERQAQKTRKYPHMMPPEGTFMHYFLTNRSIHLWITLGILLSLTGGIWYQDFVHTTPYKDILPPNSLFFAHPIQFFRRYIEVYDMHAGYVSAKTAEKRRQNVEDVKKRAEYRKAHGLEEKEKGMFGGWTAKSDDEVLGGGMRESGLPGSNSDSPVNQEEVARQAIVFPPQAPETAAQAPVVETEQATFVDFEGKIQPVEQKKWFGIW